MLAKEVCNILSELIISTWGHGDGGVIERRCAGLFQNFDAGARADASGTRLNHLLDVLEAAHATGSFHAEFAADDRAHQAHVLGRCAAGAEARGSLDEIGAGVPSGQRPAHFFFGRQQRGFEDYLADGSAAVARLGDASTS